MELTQRMDCAFSRHSQKFSSNNKIGFLGIAGATYPVVLGVNKIGRDPSCQVSLDNQTVSRQHAVVNAQSEREVLIMDMGSANGTKLENSVLSAYMPCPLRHGDVVQFGDVLGVFRSAGPHRDDFPATQRCDLPATQRCRDEHKVALSIPESPENSDIDDSLICLPKNTSLTFRNSSHKADLPNISEIKKERIEDGSTANNSRIFVPDAQAPEKSANDSIFNADTQLDRNPQNNSRIFEAETQFEPKSQDHSRMFDEDSPVDKCDVSKIFDAETQFEPKPCDNSGILNAETQIDSRPSGNSGIYNADTQFYTRPSDNSGIFNAETQIDTRPSDNSGIFNAETQAPFSEENNKNVYEQNTQFPVDRKDVHEAETQVWLGRSPLMSGTPDVDTPEDEPRVSLENSNTEERIYGAETQALPEVKPPSPSNLGRRYKEQDAVETQKWPDAKEIELEHDEVDFAETQIWPQPTSKEIPKKLKEIDKTVNMNMSEPLESDVNIEEPKCSPTFPSPSKNKTRKLSSPRAESDQEISFAEIDDDFMICASQTVMDTDFDEPINQFSKRTDAEIVNRDINVMPTQKLGENWDRSHEESGKNENHDFEDMPTQVLEVKDSKLPTESKEHSDRLEDLATQILPDVDNSDALTQFIPTSINLKNTKNKPFEEMLTQVIPEPDRTVEKIVFKVPHASPRKKKRSLNVTPISSPMKKVEESEENYYASTQDIMVELSAGRGDTSPAVVTIQRASSESSQSSSGDSQSKSFNQLFLDDLDLPNSQEITRVVSPEEIIKPTGLSVSQLSSESEDEVTVHPEILFKAPPKKKTIKNIDTSTIRRSDRPRRKTSKLQESEITNLLEIGHSDSKDSTEHKRRGRRINEEKKSPTGVIEKARVPRKAVAECSSENLSATNVKTKEEKKLVEKEKVSDIKRGSAKVSVQSEKSTKSQKATELKKSKANSNDSLAYVKESKPSSSRRTKEENKSSNEKESTQSGRERLPTTPNDREKTKKELSKEDDKPKAERRSRSKKETVKPTDAVSIERNRKKETKTTRNSDTSVVDLTVPTSKSFARSNRNGRVTPTIELQKSVNKISESENTKKELSKEDDKPKAEKRSRSKKETVIPTDAVSIEKKRKKETKSTRNSNTSVVDLTVPTSKSFARSNRNGRVTPTIELQKSANKISETDTNDVETNLRRSRRLKQDRQSENLEDNMNYSTSYDLDIARRKRSHVDSQKDLIANDIESSGSRNKRARVETINSQAKENRTEHRVSLTSFPPPAVADVKKLLGDLGAKVVDDVLECTVLVSPTLRRTLKLLCCVGLGRPVVGRRWLEASAAAGQLLDPWQHILCDEAAEKLYGCSLERSLRGGRGFLRGRRVSATPTVNPPPDDLRKIVECSGGVWCDPERGALVVTTEEDRALWSKLNRRGAVLVHMDFVLTGVLRQQADPEQYTLNT